MDLLDDWEAFLQHRPLNDAAVQVPKTRPAPSDIYISTKTIIAYLDRHIDLKTLFWAVPVILYNTPHIGVVKKQMKFNCANADEIRETAERIQACPYAYSAVITHVESATKFKDVRKVTVGLSRKDVLSHRIKAKGAFYNCVVVIMRVRVDDAFREFHVKIFNTGKIEIPGIQKEEHLEVIVETLMKTLRAVQPVEFVPASEEIVLINSNFNCNFFINREKLYGLLREKYGIMTVYDPCSYPGIQCKIYFDKDANISAAPGKALSPVAAMIFRTGSVLIVGKCTEAVLHAVYKFLNDIFAVEFDAIMDATLVAPAKKAPKVKLFKRAIMLR